MVREVVIIRKLYYGSHYRLFTINSNDARHHENRKAGDVVHNERCKLFQRWGRAGMFHMHPPQINPCCFVRWPRRFTRRGHSRHGRVPQPGHGRVPPRAGAGTAAGKGWYRRGYERTAATYGRPCILWGKVGLITWD